MSRISNSSIQGLALAKQEADKQGWENTQLQKTIFILQVERIEPIFVATLRNEETTELCPKRYYLNAIYMTKEIASRMADYYTENHQGKFKYTVMEFSAV